MRGTWESHSRQVEASGAIAERLAIQPGDRVMCTNYVYRDGGEAMMLSTSWEPLAVTGRTPVMLPEEGPLGGMGVVERMAAIDVIVDNVTEEVGARPGLAEELLALGGVPGHVVVVIQRTFFASGLLGGDGGRGGPGGPIPDRLPPAGEVTARHFGTPPRPVSRTAFRRAWWARVSARVPAPQRGRPWARLESGLSQVTDRGTTSPCSRTREES